MGGHCVHLSAEQTVFTAMKLVDQSNTKLFLADVFS